MFTGKILPKMAPHGLTFGEHCVDLEKNCKDVEPLEKQIYSENQHNVHEKCGLKVGSSEYEHLLIGIIFVPRKSS
jgi:hypothetical protein